MGNGCARCGALCSIDARSWSASFTILYCSTSTCMIAFCKYRTPPWINFVLREEVPDAKSSASTNAVFKPLRESITLLYGLIFFSGERKTMQVSSFSLPRVQASRAHPAPVAPPPIINTSYSCDFKVFTWSSRIGKVLRGGLGFPLSACTYNRHCLEE